MSIESLLRDYDDLLAGMLFYEITRRGTYRTWRRRKPPGKGNGMRARCGARTRRGTECAALALPGRSRCRHHGGLSTGPRTPEGKAAIARATAGGRKPGGRSCGGRGACGSAGVAIVAINSCLSRVRGMGLARGRDECSEGGAGA
jgi:hypothetical protein